jgi:signal transduction histidine kinase
MTPVFWGITAASLFCVWRLARPARACAEEFNLDWVAGLLDRLDIGVLVAQHGTGEILYANKKMREEFALPPEIAAGTAQRFSRSILGDDVSDGFAEKLAQSEANPSGTGGAEARVWESRNPRNQKYYRNIETLITWRNGKPAYMYHSIDITRGHTAETEQKKRERELQGALENARKADQAKSDFLSRISHEIRTPMNAVIGMTKIARQSSDMPRIQGCLENIESSSKLLLGIMNDILDMSSIDAHRLELLNAPFDFRKMLTNVCISVGVDAQEKKQVVTTQVDDSLRKMYVGDEMRLAQVVFNLMTNAVKFTPKGGRIALRAEQKETAGEEAVLEISVEDSGIGISAENLAKIFTPFEQIEGGIARKFGGMGLGLVISKNIVELMGGAFNVRSKEGQGSVFTFTVRLSPAEETPDDAPARPGAPGAGAASDAEKTADEEKKAPLSADFDGGRLLPFFDAEEALAHLKGRNKLYVLLLQSYMKNDMLEKIENALTRQDFDEALQNAQALNSIAINLGLRNLQFKVAFLVESLRSGIADRVVLEKVKFSTEETRRLVPDMIVHLEKGKTPS